MAETCQGGNFSQFGGLLKVFLGDQKMNLSVPYVTISNKETQAKVRELSVPLLL